MNLLDAVTGAVILVGLVGVVVPLLPGGALVVAAVVVWALLSDDPTAWAWALAASLAVVTGAVAKYVVPGRRLSAQGVPRSSLLVGGLAGLVGFFVIPVLGLLLGLVAGIYLAELQRLGSHDRAWPTTRAALHAAGLSLLIELGATLAAASLWLIGAVTTG